MPTPVVSNAAVALVCQEVHLWVAGESAVILERLLWKLFFAKAEDLRFSQLSQLSGHPWLNTTGFPAGLPQSL